MHFLQSLGNPLTSYSVFVLYSRLVIIPIIKVLYLALQLLNPLTSNNVQDNMALYKLNRENTLAHIKHQGEAFQMDSNNSIISAMEELQSKM